MKLVHAAVVSAWLVSSLVAQVAVAKEHLAKAKELAAAKDPFGAAQQLWQAHVHLGPVAAGSDRDAVAAEIASVVPDIDPLLPRRRDLERRVAERFATMSKSLLDAGCPRAAVLMAKDAALFDPVLAEEALRAAEAGTKTVDLRTKAAQLDASFDAWFKTAGFFQIGKDGKRAKKVSVPKDYAALHRDIPVWFKERQKAAKDTRSMAMAYKGKGMVETAFVVLQIGYEMHRDAVRKDYEGLRVGAREQRAERRYLRVSKPHMDELRNNSDRLGPKGWKFGKRVLNAPKASTKTAILVSKRKLKGDYLLEVEMQLEEMLGSMQVVVAWRSPDDYVVLEFVRPRRPHSLLRIVHVANGSRQVLKEGRARQTMRDYFSLQAEVRGGTITARLGTGSCSAACPIDTSAGVSYGFARPALAQKSKKKAPINLRNLVVTER